MDPFSSKELNKIFKVSASNPLRLISRESTWLEFKESFNTFSLLKYAKAIASYANKEGGYIIFGVKDNPRDIVGLNNDNFEKIDSAHISKKLNEHFSPEIVIDMQTYEYKELKIGIIYVFKSNNKPIICKKSVNESANKLLLREGSIYYRYGGKNEVIKYEELVNILNKKQELENKAWLKTIGKIAKVGVNNVGILDILNGKITTSNNATLLLDESLIKNLKFIQEGEFSETEGAPTLKLVGEFKTIDNKVLQPTKFIKTLDPIVLNDQLVIESFLKQEKLDSPLSFIETICNYQIKYMPFYYFLYLEQQNNINFNKKNAMDYIKRIKDARKGKDYLFDRLTNDDNFKAANLNCETTAGKKRRDFFNLLSNKKINSDTKIINNEQKCLFEIILNFNSDNIQPKYILDYLLSLHIRPDGISQIAKGDFRKAVAYIDKILYRDIFFK
jgi:hypothetical protein